MRALSQAEIRGMTNALVPTFTTTAQVERPVETSDGAGGTTTVRSVVATIKCHYYHSAGSTRAEQEEGTRIEVVEPWTFLVPPGSNVKHADRLLVSGRTFEISTISGPQTVDIIWTLGCEEIL